MHITLNQEFHSNKTNRNSKNKWEENGKCVKLHVPVHNMPVIGGSYAEIKKKLLSWGKTSIISIYKA